MECRPSERGCGNCGFSLLHYREKEKLNVESRKECSKKILFIKVCLLRGFLGSSSLFMRIECFVPFFSFIACMFVCSFCHQSFSSEQFSLEVFHSFSKVYLLFLLLPSYTFSLIRIWPCTASTLFENFDFSIILSLIPPPSLLLLVLVVLVIRVFVCLLARVLVFLYLSSLFLSFDLFFIIILIRLCAFTYQRHTT